MPRGIYPRQPRLRGETLAVARCRCGWAWKPTTGFSREACPRCGVIRDVCRRKDTARPGGLGVLKQLRKADPLYATRLYRKHRLTVLLLVGKGTVACVRCGCPNPDLLEINHKNGGGQIELRGHPDFYRQIAKLRRATDDLELLCRVCNAHHALELKYGPLPFVVRWQG